MKNVVSLSRFDLGPMRATGALFWLLIAVIFTVFYFLILFPQIDKQSTVARVLSTAEYLELRQATIDRVTSPGKIERAIYQYSVNPFLEVRVEIVAIGTEHGNELKAETPTVWVLHNNVVLFFSTFLVLLVLSLLMTRRGWSLYMLSPRYREVTRVQQALFELAESLRTLHSESENKVVPFGQKEKVWLAKARDLLTLGLQSDASLLKQFDEVTTEVKTLADKEMKTPAASVPREYVIAISDILRSAGEMILINTHARGSLVDNLALASVGAADAEHAVEAFEMKRALYESFARSWPMRVVLVLLLIALGLTGWQIFDLANLGVEARATVAEAKDRVATTLTDVRRLASEASQHSENAAERLMEAAALQKSTKESLDNSYRQAVVDIEERKELANRALLSSAKSAKTAIKEVREKGLADIKEQLEDEASVLRQELSARLEELAKNGEKDIQREIEVGMGMVTEARSRVTNFISDTKIILAEEIENGKVQVLNFQESQRSDAEAYLQRTKSRKETELNNRAKELQKDLDRWEGVGKERIDAVASRMEAKESEWNRRSEDRFKALAVKANEIDTTLAEAEKRYVLNVALLNQTNELMDQVVSAARLDPVWLAAVLELRTAILVVSVLAALLAAAVAVIGAGSRRRSSGPDK